ncbi:MAG: CHAT domain-containing protein [Phycisphaerales bacterium]|nr:CHAT domain-containing protein [Phycisphaerales bacterium]
MTTLHIRQQTISQGKHDIRLTLKRPSTPDLEARATIDFALTSEEQEELRWYMEDYLHRAESVADVQIEQIEAWMNKCGDMLYKKVLDDNQNTRAIWFAIREQLADIRIEIAAGIAEAASIPWEMMRDPQSDSAIALRVRSFVRVQSNPNISFVPVPPAEGDRLRLLYVVCRPGGRNDVELRAVANRLLQDLGSDLARFEITALRPPTFEHLQRILTDAKSAGRPFHIVHFDGHGVFGDLKDTTLSDWAKAISPLMLHGKNSGKHGYLLFEHPGSKENIRPVSGSELGKLLHDTGVPVLVLNACQSAMHDTIAASEYEPAGVHDEVRAIGSLAQAVLDHGVPAVLGMRYSVFVVTAAQYIGQLYAALARGRSFGEAATEGRKHLSRNPDRWVGLQPRPLQDWFVPVVYEAAAIHLLPPKAASPSLEIGRPEIDPAQTNPALRRYVPDTGFVGRDETLLMLDRAFDQHAVVLLHAYAGQGKSATAVEFARWYAQTGGLGPRPHVLLTSFETHTALTNVLNQIGQEFAPALQASGIDWNATNDNSVRCQLVLQILQHFPVLWIWDNVEPVTGFPDGTESAWTPAEQVELADFLKQISIAKGMKARVLVTSRRDEQAWLGGVPQRVEMPRMSLSDSASLARSLGNERKIAREDVADWQALLRYCNGNPLTLRVVVGQAIRMKLSGREQIARFVEAIRSGEQAIEDTDGREGRDKSLGASLDYGIRHSFKDEELPVIALLHLFQGTVMVDVLEAMGKVGDHALPELAGKAREDLVSLLDRARETGLLTHLGENWYGIHPALPWFLRQRFVRCYDGQAGRSTSAAALRAWTEAIGELGAYYNSEYIEGNPQLIGSLELEEANLLHARRIARRHGWWDSVIGAMQGLRHIHYFQGRISEWSRLVAEITPDYCTSTDAPFAGREDQYCSVMEYRVLLAILHNRDLVQAAVLQEKVVEWIRQRAAPALALPPAAALSVEQRNHLRALAVSIGTFGQILKEQGRSDCVAAYEEAIRHAQRIQDAVVEATSHFNLGHAYKDIPEIRNLDAAEAAYRRELPLLNPNDLSGRASTNFQIGAVHHERFRESLQRSEVRESALIHAQAAEAHYLQALTPSPGSSFVDLGPRHAQLANLYSELRAFDHARVHFEKAIQCYERADNRYDAGRVRLDMAGLYATAAWLEAAPLRKRDLLSRAQAYAQAAVRDFRNYSGRAADAESIAQAFLTAIADMVAALPPIHASAD